MPRASRLLRGEYDGYIEPLRDLIQSGADEDAIVSYLHEREQETMCFPSLGTRRLLPVARKLLRLRRDLIGRDKARNGSVPTSPARRGPTVECP